MIRPNTCPYCLGPYTLADGGCRIHCAGAERAAQLVRDAIDADLRETDEWPIPQEPRS